MSNKAKPLPMDIIREALEIDSESKTHLRWRVRPRGHFGSDRARNAWNAKNAGAIAGSEFTGRKGKSYYRVKIGGIYYFAHRIIYALTHGIDPADREIDHIDGSGLSNDPLNLRLATKSENQMNRGVQRNNTSGRKGVTWHNLSRKWMAQIKLNGRNKHLGLFTSIDEAAAAYDLAARQLYGEFYREEKTK